jgi:AcrR family transcriptional regulator
MAYPAYLRERARALRVTKALTLDEVAERLALPKTTVYYWIKDLPLGRPRRGSPGQRKGNQSMQAKYRRLREGAYERGRVEYDELVSLPTFRDFVVLYVAEGCKRNRNRVAIGNSDARMVAMAASWMRSFTNARLFYSLQYHADQRLAELRSHWGGVLAIDGSIIRLQRKSNSGQLTGRTWRSAHGVLTVTVFDTLLRARLQAWMDRTRADWCLDSGRSRGVAQPGSAYRLGR